MQVNRGIPSANVHVSRMLISHSSKAAAISSSHRSFHLAKSTILTVIGLLMLVMILATFFWIIATPEFLVKKQIDDISADYYKNYFYPAILDSNQIKKAEISAHSEDINRIFGTYKDTGFSRLTMRQLLLYDNQKHIGAMSELAKYCDLDKTLLKFYPDAPYGEADYHINYTYSCKF